MIPVGLHPDVKEGITMGYAPITNAATLGQALGQDSEWFDEQHFVVTPDLNVWPSLLVFPSLHTVATGQELTLLANYGSEADPINWASDQHMTEATQRLVARIKRLLGNNAASVGILFWGYDSLLIWITGTGTQSDPGFVYCLEGTWIKVYEIEPADILGVILETWRRGGAKADEARKWLCDAVVTAIESEHRQVVAVQT
jgi:hypothetical protein